VITLIPYGRQNINQDDIDSVVSVLRSDFVTQGPLVPSFESAVAKFCNAKYGIAVNSGTSALHIACLALGVTNGDIVWTSPISFVASANCAIYCGASIDFVDINPITYNLDIDKLSMKLLQARLDGNLPKVLIPVHLAGQSCEMEKIHKLSVEYGFKIIEDGSHAIGARYKDAPVGSCQYSDITVFSFHPVKIITTGEGGMALTNDSILQRKMALYRSHGITRDPEDMIDVPHGPWYYEQIEIGYNYRMTDFQAALGLSQLNRLDEFVRERNDIAAIYDEVLSGLPIKLPEIHQDCYSSFHLYIVRIDSKKISHKTVFEQCRSRGIAVNLHYIPIYRHPFYRKFNYDVNNFPEAEAYYVQAISLPIFPGISRTQLDLVAASLVKPIGHQTLF